MYHFFVFYHIYIHTYQYITSSLPFEIKNDQMSYHQISKNKCTFLPQLHKNAGLLYLVKEQERELTTEDAADTVTSYLQTFK